MMLQSLVTTKWELTGYVGLVSGTDIEKIEEEDVAADTWRPQASRSFCRPRPQIRLLGGIEKVARTSGHEWYYEQYKRYIEKMAREHVQNPVKT